MDVITAPMHSISDLKKAPMSIMTEAEATKTAIYILNNNKMVGVVMSPALFEALVEQETAQKQKIAELEDKILDLTIEKIALERLQMDLSTAPIEHLLGENWNKGLENIPDDWE